MAKISGVLGAVLLIASGLGACSSSDDGGGETAATTGAAAMGVRACPMAPETCGNGLVDPGETCDQGNQAQGIQANFNNETCATLMSGSGSLTCTCCQLDTAMCVTTPAGAAGGAGQAGGVNSAAPVGGQGG